MTIRDRVKPRYPRLPYEEWHKKLWRQFALLMGGIIAMWIAAGLFTVWLLRG